VLYATLARTRRPAMGRLNSGVRRQKALCSFAIRNCDSPASVSIALRTHFRPVAASFNSAMRAHTAHALRLLASDSLRRFRFVLSLQQRSLRTGPAESSWGRAQASGLRPFGKYARVSPSPASFPPNKSFKPTPCLGFVETCRHAGNTGSLPPRSARLNSGVRR